jgi:hypothetical protein
MTCEPLEQCHNLVLMPSLEAVCGRLFGHSGWMPKVLWGGLLSFIPFLNLFSLGYLLEYTIRLRQSRQWELPEWRDMEIPSLLSNGVRMLLIILAYGGIPIIVGWLARQLVDFLSLGLLGIVSYFPLALSGFLSPFLVLASIHAYLQDGLFSDCWDIRGVLISARATWPDLIIPVIAFWGIILLALPLYGLAFFIGSWVLLAYSSALEFAKSQNTSSIR